MKKIFLLSIASLVCMTTLSAQISQQEADSIVQQRLSDETKPYCVYAKEDVQTGFEVTTATGETLELSYPAWVYYVSYTRDTNGKYLIVKENNGNVLEVNTKNDAEPDDLENWRIVVEDEYPIEIPFEEYSLEGTFCQWKNIGYPHLSGELIIINNNEELENYISCTEGSFPEIDFLKHTLLLANGHSSQEIFEIVTAFSKISRNQYVMNILVYKLLLMYAEPWCVPILVPKITDEKIITLDVQYIYY